MNQRLLLCIFAAWGCMTGALVLAIGRSNPLVNPTTIDVGLSVTMALLAISAIVALIFGAVELQRIDSRGTSGKGKPQRC